MVKEAPQVVVFVFYDAKKDEVLLERRPLTSRFSNFEIFPGGEIEPDEIDDIEHALRREAREELGVEPTQFSQIATREDIFGETGKQLRPYLITGWEGQLPETVLDKGNRLLWVRIEAIATDLPSMRKITESLRAHLSRERE